MFALSSETILEVSGYYDNNVVLFLHGTAFYAAVVRCGS